VKKLRQSHEERKDRVLEQLRRAPRRGILRKLFSCYSRRREVVGIF
jgi:hypothetical protein